MIADPAMGEYVTADRDNAPVGGVFTPLNLQTYHYAGNNPVFYLDPSGLVVMHPGEQGSSGIGSSFLGGHLPPSGGGLGALLASVFALGQQLLSNKKPQDNPSLLIDSIKLKTTDGALGLNIGKFGLNVSFEHEGVAFELSVAILSVSVGGNKVDGMNVAFSAGIMDIAGGEIKLSIINGVEISAGINTEIGVLTFGNVEILFDLTGILPEDLANWIKENGSITLTNEQLYALRERILSKLSKGEAEE